MSALRAPSNLGLSLKDEPLRNIVRGAPELPFVDESIDRRRREADWRSVMWCRTPSWRGSAGSVEVYAFPTLGFCCALLRLSRAALGPPWGSSGPSRRCHGGPMDCLGATVCHWGLGAPRRSSGVSGYPRASYAFPGLRSPIESPWGSYGTLQCTSVSAPAKRLRQRDWKRLAGEEPQSGR